MQTLYVWRPLTYISFATQSNVKSYFQYVPETSESAILIQFSLLN